MGYDENLEISGDLYPADQPGTGQPLSSTPGLAARKAEELKERRAERTQQDQEELEAGTMHGESGNYIGYDPLPDLPYPDPYSIGYDDPQWSRKENKTKGAASGPYLTLPVGPPRSRSNQSRNPARQLYSSTQGSSYSKDDPRKFWCLDQSVQGGEIDATTFWQSGKSDNQMIYDHTCENAGYWSSNGGPYCNWRNFNVTSGDGGGKPYKPAILEAETKNGGLTMLYNLGHGTRRATPEGYDMNITGASGYLIPQADKNQNNTAGNEDVVCSLNVAHMYLMYRSDLTNAEFEQLEEDIDNFPWDDLQDIISGDDPTRFLLDQALRKRLSKKIPYSPYREVYFNIIASAIGNATKRRSPDMTALMRVFKSGELTFLTALEWIAHNCAHTVTETAWFQNSGLDLNDLWDGKSWYEKGDLTLWFKDVIEDCDFTQLIEQYGSNKPKPPTGGGGGSGGGGNNRPNRPRPDYNLSRDPWKRNAMLAWHKLQYPKCQGPPCNHLGGGPDYSIEGQHKVSWPEAMWNRWHKKEHPDCPGSWTVGDHKGTWCPHLPGHYGGSNSKPTWDRLSEGNKKKFWQKWHDYLYPKCPGKWEPQRSLFPDTGGYCWHHPKSSAFEPDHEQAEKIRDELIQKDPEAWGKIIDARDKNENIVNIQGPNSNNQKPGMTQQELNDWVRKYCDNLGPGHHTINGKNGAKVEVDKDPDGKTSIKFQNQKLNGKNRDFTVTKEKDPNTGEEITTIKDKDGKETKIRDGGDSTHLETLGPDGDKVTVEKDKNTGKVTAEDDKTKVETSTNPNGDQETKITDKETGKEAKITEDEDNVRLETDGPNDEKITANKDKDKDEVTVESSGGGKATVKPNTERGGKDVDIDLGDGTTIKGNVGDNGELDLKINSKDNEEIELGRDEDGKWKIENGRDQSVQITEDPDGGWHATVNNKPGDDNPIRIDQDKDGNITAQRDDKKVEINTDENNNQHIKLETDEIKADVNVDPHGGISGVVEGPGGKTSVSKDPTGKTELTNENGDKATHEKDSEGNDKITTEKANGTKTEATVGPNGQVTAEITDKDDNKTKVEREENGDIKVDRDDKPTVNIENIEVDPDGNKNAQINIEPTEDKPGGSATINQKPDGSGSLEFEGIPDWLFDEDAQDKIDDLADKGVKIDTSTGNLKFEWESSEGGNSDWWPDDKPVWWPSDDKPERPERPEDRPGLGEWPKPDLPQRPGTGDGRYPNRPEGGVPERPGAGSDAPIHQRLRDFIIANGPIDCGNGNSLSVDDKGNIVVNGINVNKDDVANNNDNINREDLDNPIDLPGGRIYWDDVTGSLTWTPREPDQIPEDWKDNGYPGFHLNLKDPDSDKEINIWKDEENNLIVDGKPVEDANFPEGMEDKIRELFGDLREVVNGNRPGLSFDDLSPENKLKWKEKVNELQNKINNLEDLANKIEGIQKAYDWITFLKQFGVVGELIALVIGGMKGLISIVGAVWSEFKSMDYLGELTVPRPFDECTNVFPNRRRDEDKTKWTNFYPKYFNKEINGISQAMVQLLCCRINGYLIDCTTVSKKGTASISRLGLSYLTPTYGIGLGASDMDHPFYRVLPRAYPDPGRRMGTSNYDSNPRRGESTSLKMFRDHIGGQAEMSDIAKQHLSYWQPDIAQVIVGPSHQYWFDTQGGLRRKTGTLEAGWSEIWRTSGFMNHDACGGFYQHNIVNELGFGIFCDVNYRTSNSCHATWMEMTSLDPKPWPFKRDDMHSPRVTMDLEFKQLNNGSIHKKTAKFWQFHQVIANFFDKDGNRRAIEMRNYENQWINRAGGTGYQFKSGTENEVGKLHQFWHYNLEDQQDWGPDGNTNHARAPLHLAPKNDDWKAWFDDDCLFIGFSFAIWPQDQSSGEDSDSIAGVGGNSWKACLLKRLRFVRNWPSSYHTLFPREVTEEHNW